MVYQASDPSRDDSSLFASPAKASAFQALRQAIISGEYRPGDALVERQLVDRYNVSRSSIREILRVLQHQGLVELYVQQGAFVRKLSAADLRDIFEVREALETLAARLAARNSSPDEIEALLQEGDEQAQATPMSTHEFVIAQSGNNVLRSMYAQIRNQLLLIRGMSKEASRAFDQRGNSEHREVLEAIAAGDEQRAEDAMREHLRHVRTAVLEKFFEVR